VMGLLSRREPKKRLKGLLPPRRRSWLPRVVPAFEELPERDPDAPRARPGGKQRFRCRKCGRRGTYKSMKGRRRFRVAEYFRRKLGIHGEGACRNAMACAVRQAVRKPRRRRYMARAEPRRRSKAASISRGGSGG
jgi:hypothetical protein